MKRDQIKNLILQFLLMLFLFFTLFESNIITRWVLAIFLCGYTIIINLLIKKRKILSIYNRQVCILMVFLAIIYLAGFYLLGMYFGFVRSAFRFSLWTIFKFVIPTIIIIFTSEYIRYIFLSQNGKTSKILVYISMVILDLIVYVNLYNIVNLNELLRVVGYIFFASVSCNLLYNYVSSRFGYKPIIIYRLITALYIYFIPVIPNLYIFFKSTLRIIYPYIIYLILENTFARANKFSEYRDHNIKILNTTITVVVAVLITMLVSCKFTYGILVIGSGSMSGEINKGDAVIYRKLHNNHEISEGQVLVFNKNGMRIIHRVIKKINVNGQDRYITKGDANSTIDDGYIVTGDVVGIVKMKIRYLGYPTLWVNELFENR